MLLWKRILTQPILKASPKRKTTYQCLATVTLSSDWICLNGYDFGSCVEAYDFFVDLDYRTVDEDC